MVTTILTAEAFCFAGDHPYLSGTLQHVACDVHLKNLNRKPALTATVLPTRPPTSNLVKAKGQSTSAKLLLLGIQTHVCRNERTIHREPPVAHLRFSNHASSFHNMRPLDGIISARCAWQCIEPKANMCTESVSPQLDTDRCFQHHRHV